MSRITLSAALVLAFSITCAAQAKDTQILHTYSGKKDGAEPIGNLVEDGAGNLYGATAHGGQYDGGVVYRLAPDGTHTVLHSFSGGNDGGLPLAGLVMDKAGNLYGTTESGGTRGGGLVFKLTPDGAKTTLHDFTGGDDGAFPHAGLFMDKHGNLYGTTQNGGRKNMGTVFEISAKGKERVLYAFHGDKDGLWPEGRVIKDTHGNLYGTTYYGGPGGAGEVFKLAPDGSKTVLHAFTDGDDGGFPASGLVMDEGGNLYGTAYSGGEEGVGTIFKIDAAGKFSVLYSVEGSVGSNPVTDLIMDKSGTLFGAISFGSGQICCGALFKLSADGAFTVLHTFTGHDGAEPNSLFMDQQGNFYGTTVVGGRKNHGTVFRLLPAK